MQADPQRQWFVYFNEKELGPFSESDVQQKLASGELNTTAYLFTEGMADWALVDDVEVFKIQQSAPKSSGKTTESKSWEPKKLDTNSSFETPKDQFTNTGFKTNTQATVKESAEPTVRGKTKVKGTNVKGKLASSPSGSKKKVLTALLALLVVGLGYLIYQDQKDNFGKEKAPVVKKTVGADANTPSAPAKASNADVNWKDLQTLRESNDPSTAPFRISEGNLGGDRPIVVGVLSQMIKADRVQVAVYSDNEKSLAAIPRIWFLDIPLVDGYFTAGPFTTEGQALLSGTYHVAVAANGNFLGEVSFTQGTWPSDADLSKLQAKIQSERTLLAEKEVGALNEKLQEMNAAYSQLEVVGKVALLGPKRANEWKSKSAAWRKILKTALEEQRSSMAGPMFYAEAQQKLYAFMSSMMKHYEALDMNAKEGAAFVTKVKGKGVGQLWTQLKNEKDALNGEIQASLKNPPGTLKIDSEIVKNRLIEMSK